jgi:hypothetical protein
MSSHKENKRYDNVIVFIIPFHHTICLCLKEIALARAAQKAEKAAAYQATLQSTLALAAARADKFETDNSAKAATPDKPVLEVDQIQSAGVTVTEVTEVTELTEVPDKPDHKSDSDYGWVAEDADEKTGSDKVKKGRKLEKVKDLTRVCMCVCVCDTVCVCVCVCVYVCVVCVVSVCCVLCM